MKSLSSKTIVFITGAFVSHQGWTNWIDFFKAEGYTCYAPPWKYKDGTPEELRKLDENNNELKDLRLAAVIEQFATFITKLPEKPILIGHSTGGLIVQVLLQKGIAEAGIAIHSVPAQGVLSFKFSFLKSLWGPLGLFSTIDKTYLMTFGQWQYAFTNGMSYEDQLSAYKENVIPESKRLIRDCLSSDAKVDFTKPHVPLLFISGSTDNIIPASLNYSNYKKYKANGSVTDYKEFEGKNHFVLGLATWKEEAKFCLEWLNNRN
ncbi:alpha/beta hydrolase [Robertkochia solimangrovi]|uniref:alpha/beta hydrolase n=1 Tax=Robertkochia solimangrovi TaxID=2213046 RepID=UPI00117FDA26|nr:alpha/beta hydrolase [Robertkochia solimangrovi]TRZ41975.1 alpha/beta hydrolase [Robertkochia solimangrovi]